MSEGLGTTGPRIGREPPSFAHASEAELARILDFYEVRWEYEPHVYPILWSLDGDVLESFAPDFYLPDLDLYVELTTLRQKLVRKKNRKLRRLRELYPDIRIKLFYARDFRALMLKYGKLAIVDELSGAIGQVVPVRPEDAVETVTGPPGITTPSGSVPPPASSSPVTSPGVAGAPTRVATARFSAVTPVGGSSGAPTDAAPRPASTAAVSPVAPGASRTPRSRRTREAPAR